jgi:hypothetical protein
MLKVEFERIRKMLGSVSALSWVALNMNGDRLDMIEASTDPDLRSYAANLAKALKAWRRPEDKDAASTLYELYAEAIALQELKSRAQQKGFTIRRTPPSGKPGVKTPDFECECSDGLFYIEVKTPDIVGGVYATATIMREAQNHSAELKSRLQPGVNFGEPLEIAPHGEGAANGPYAEIIESYTRRILNNVKKAQLTYGPTVLLVYDGRLSLDTRDPTCLVPTYFFEAPKPTADWPGECVSGDWWHVGFGRVGNQILIRSEFEGKGNLGGQLRADGLLIEYPSVLGLAIMSGGKWSEPELAIYTLAQTWRSELPDDEKFQYIDPCSAAYLISDAYNDRANGNGCRYQVRR